jgi:hypothetical protein
MQLAQLISVIHLARRELGFAKVDADGNDDVGAGGADGAGAHETLLEQEEVAQIMSYIVNLQSKFENFAELEIVRQLGAIVPLPPGPTNEATGLKGTSSADAAKEALSRARQVAGAINKIIVGLTGDIHGVTASDDSQLLQYDNLPVSTLSNRKSEDGGYFSFNFDDLPLLTPIDPILKVLRTNPWDISSLQSLLAKDSDDYFEHPQWFDILSVVKQGLHCEDSRNQDGCYLCWLFHIHLLKSLPEIQFVDVMEIIIERLSMSCIIGDVIEERRHGDNSVQCFFPADLLTRTKLAAVLLMIKDLPDKIIQSDMRRSDGIILALFTVLTRGRMRVRCIEARVEESPSSSMDTVDVSLLELIIAGSTACNDGLQQFMSALLRSWPPYSVLNHVVHSGFLQFSQRRLRENFLDFQKLAHPSAALLSSTVGHNWVGMDPLQLTIKRICVFCSMMASLQVALTADSLSPRMLLLTGCYPRIEELQSKLVSHSTDGRFHDDGAVASTSVQRPLSALSQQAGSLLVPMKESANANRRLYICCDCDQLLMLPQANDTDSTGSHLCCDPIVLSAPHMLQVLVECRGVLDSSDGNDASSRLKSACVDAISVVIDAIPPSVLSKVPERLYEGLEAAILAEKDIGCQINILVAVLKAAHNLVQNSNSFRHQNLPALADMDASLFGFTVSCLGLTCKIPSLFAATKDDEISDCVCALLKELCRLYEVIIGIGTYSSTVISVSRWLLVQGIAALTSSRISATCQDDSVFQSATDITAAELSLLSGWLHLFCYLFSEVTLISKMIGGVDNPHIKADIEGVVESVLAASNFLVRTVHHNCIWRRGCELTDPIQPIAVNTATVVQSLLNVGVVMLSMGDTASSTRESYSTFVMTSVMPLVPLMLHSDRLSMRCGGDNVDMSSAISLCAGLVQLGYVETVLEHALFKTSVSRESETTRSTIIESCTNLILSYFDTESDDNSKFGVSKVCFNASSTAVEDVLLVVALDAPEFRRKVFERISSSDRNNIHDVLRHLTLNRRCLSDENAHQLPFFFVKLKWYSWRDNLPGMNRSPKNNTNKRARISTTGDSGDSSSDGEGSLASFVHGDMVPLMIHQVLAQLSRHSKTCVRRLLQRNICMESTVYILLTRACFCGMLTSEEFTAVTDTLRRSGHTSASQQRPEDVPTNVMVDIVTALLVLAASVDDKVEVDDRLVSFRSCFDLWQFYVEELEEKEPGYSVINDIMSVVEQIHGNN